MTVHQVLAGVRTWVPKNMPIRGFTHILNDVIKRIRAKGSWSWMFATDTIETTEEYTTGTADVENASTTVSGTGTTWTSGMVGCKIRFAGGPEYTISAVGSATAITLTEKYTGETDTGLTYTIYQNVYSLASDCQRVVKLWDTTNGRGIASSSAAQLRTKEHESFTCGDVTEWAPWGRDTNKYPRVYLFPYPADPVVIEYVYLKKHTELTKPDDDIGLPDSLDDVIISGCLANVFRQAKDWEAFRINHDIFSAGLTREWLNDQIPMDFQTRLARQDEVDTEASVLNVSPVESD
mgnify:CR=1 FL=1